MTAPSPRPTWLLLLFAAAVVIGLFNVGMLLYGLTLPDEWKVEESIEIAAPPEAIFPLLASPRSWHVWSSWNKQQDPTLELNFSGPEAGEGASSNWIAETFGRGKLTILEAKPNELVRYELDLQGTSFSKNGRLTLEPVANGTRVRWQDGGELGSTLGRLFRERFEDSVAADFAASLARLKKAVEQPGDDSKLPGGET